MSPYRDDEDDTNPQPDYDRLQEWFETKEGENE
jgi:hypothetical protein